MVCLSSPDPTRLILTFGAKVNARDKVNGNTALHWACTSGNHAVTKLLLDAGADMSLMNARVSIYINYIAHRRNIKNEKNCEYNDNIDVDEVNFNNTI